MSDRLWSGLVILKDHGADVDLSKKWSVIEYEDASPQSVVITLNAARGRFITQGTKIQKWDRIYVELTDQAGKKVKDVFWVNTMKRQRKKGKGLQLILHCPHQSSNLMKQTIAKPGRRSSGKDAMNDLINQMNVNRGSSDPSIETVSPFDITNKLGNNLDEGTTNDYIFEAYKARTAIDEIIQREGTPVEVGGSFQFHYFRFKSKYDHDTDSFLDVVQLQVFQQGFMENQSSQFTNIPQVTLTKPLLSTGDRANVLALDTDMEVEKGTNLIAIGNKVGGTYPIDYSRFLGAKTVFENALPWEDGKEYISGIIVTWAIAGSISTYQCIQDNLANDGVNDPTTGLGTFWIGPITFDIPPTWVAQGGGYTNTFDVKHNEIAYQAIVTHSPSDSSNEPPNTEFWTRLSWLPTTEYSTLTNNKFRHWLNAGGGSKYYSTFGFKDNVAVVDPSVIIKDAIHPRTWVDAVTNDSVLLLLKTDLMQNGLPFDGFRVLCVDPTDGTSTGEGAFAGNDPNGESMGGNILEWRDPQLTNPSTTGDWFVYKVTDSDQEVYDFEDGFSWVRSPCNATLSAVNNNGACVFIIGGSPATRSSVWEKGSYRLSELPNGKFGLFVANSSFECVHNISWNTGLGHSDIGNEQLGEPNSNALFEELNSDTSAVFVHFNPLDLTQFGNFAGLNFAFPWPRQNTGGQTIGSEINLPMFDLDNMHLSRDRDRIWYGPEVEDYFPIQDFAFLEFFREQALLDIYTGPGGPKRQADYSMAVWLADRNDTVITMDYTHSHNNNAFPQTAKVGKQKIYRAIPGTSIFIPGQAPEILDIFDFRNVVRGGIYTRDSFDAQNRYKGVLSRFQVQGGISEDIKLSIDAFRMTKPLVCTNADEPLVKNERNIEPAKLQWDQITNYAQLKNYVLAQAAITGFRTDRFEVETPGRCNIAWGDPVFYNDTEAIDVTFDPSGLDLDNTIRATANKITYSLSKGADGPGGFIRTIDLVTRLYPDDTP